MGMPEDQRSIENDVRVYRRRKELLEKFEIIFQKTNPELDFIWEDIKASSKPTDND